LRPVAGDSELAEAVKVLTRAHKTLIGERSRHTLRLRQALLDFFPAAVDAFADLAAPDSLQLLTIGPDSVSAAGLSVGQIVEALALARRHHRAARAEQIAAVLRDARLTQPDLVAGAYAATVRAQAAILTVLNTQIAVLEEQVKANFGEHPDVQVYLSQPGLGFTLGARVLAEFGDDQNRYRDAKARKNYACCQTNATLWHAEPCDVAPARRPARSGRTSAGRGRGRSAISAQASRTRAGRTGRAGQPSGAPFNKSHAVRDRPPGPARP
jgi:hypothetical protein